MANSHVHSPAMHEIARVDGPAYVFGFDAGSTEPPADDEMDEPVQLQLVRDNGSVLINMAIQPWQPYPTPANEPPLCQTGPGAEIFVKQDESVVLQSSSSRTRGNILRRDVLPSAEPARPVSVNVDDLARTSAAAPRARRPVSKRRRRASSKSD